MGEDFILFVGAPLALFGVGYLSYRFAKLRSAASLLGLACVWLMFTVFMYAGAESSRTVDWALYVAALIFISGPAAVGLLVGGAIGWFRGR